MKPVIITIDGPAGTGKSTVAHRLAATLGFEFLDTGAMYRAAALVAIDRDIAPGDGPALAEALGSVRFRFDWAADPPRTMLDDRDVSARIRDRDVSEIVSMVAAQPEVREVLVRRQRAIAEEHPRLVTEGRDQGSVVFPDAPLRIYLDADVKERARRRQAQLASAGRSVDPSAVMSGIRERDRIDSTRPDGPLIRPEGAVVVDTTRRSEDQVVECLVSIAREQLPEAGFTS